MTRRQTCPETALERARMRSGCLPIGGAVTARPGPNAPALWDFQAGNYGRGMIAGNPQRAPTMGDDKPMSEN